MFGFGKGRRRRTALLAALVTLVATPLVVSQAGAVLSLANPPSFQFVNDESGADDQPGQKDLNAQAVATPSPGDLWVSWTWDDTSLSGGNTGDACALFDTDSDSKVNFGVCVTIQGNPAVQAPVSPRVYTCGDGKVDRCTSTYTQITPINTACATNTNATDPFHNGKKDTQAICHVDLADVGGSGTAKLINTCSYPSQSPTSAPSDCVLIPRDAFVTIVKNATPNTTGAQFPFRLGTSTTGSSNPVAFTATNSQTSDPIAIRSGTLYTLKEDIPTNWAIDTPLPSCTGSTATGGNGTFNSVDTIGSIKANSDDVITCTYNDRRLTGAIEITKQHSGTTTALSGAHFSIDGAGDYVTDSTGKACLAGLVLGDHTVTETTPPAGYSLASPATQTISVTSAGTCTSGATSATFNDPAVKGTVTIHKTIAGGTTALAGATFTLYTDVAPLGGSRNLTNTDPITSPALTCMTDSTGLCTISNVPLGDYWVVETGVPNGYDAAADQRLNVGLGTSPNTGDSDDLYFSDAAHPGSITITKTGVGGALLNGAVFELYTKGIGETAHNALNDTGKGCTTSGAGTCTITGVVPGDYWIVEVTPPNGYDSASDTAVTVGLGGTPGAGASVPVTIADPPAPGTVHISKTDDAATPNALAGAEFTLYTDVAPTGGTRNQTNTDPITSPVLKCTTGVAGTCDITGVPLGNYWIVETNTPTHYDTAADKTVTVDAGTSAPHVGDLDSVSFVDPRRHRVVVLVCHEGTDSLVQTPVTVSGVTKQSLAAGILSSTQQKALCDTGGASFGDISGHPTVSASVALGG